MAEQTPSTSNFANGFMWLATILGFIVDTITLVGLFSTFEVRSENAPDSIQIPKIKIVAATPELRDSTFVLIIISLFMLMLYIGSVFYKKEQKKHGDYYDDIAPESYENDDVTISPTNDSFPIAFSVFGVSLLILLFALWFLVFHFQNSVLWENIYFVFAIWIVGTILSLCMVVMRSISNNKMGKILKTTVLVFIVSILPLGLIGEWIFGITLLTSIIGIVQIGILSFSYIIVIFFLTALMNGITLIAVKWYYESNLENEYTSIN